MKSLAELIELRDKALAKVNMRDGKAHKQIIVGMGTCGIAAGARPVVQAFMEELEKNELTTVTITLSGCMGDCVQEPVVQVVDDKGEKTTYVNMTPEKAAKVVAEHVIGGTPVAEFKAAE